MATRSRLCIALLLVIAATAAPARAADPFYGVFTDDAALSVQARRDALARQAATGVGVIREQIHWDRIERSPGVYDWSSLDGLVADAADQRLRILPVLVNQPAFASSPAPVNPQAMAQFAAKLVERYGRGGTFWCPGIRLLGLVLSQEACRQPYLPMTAWQVWNEPDFPGWWSGKPDPAAYTRLLSAVAVAIKLTDPRAEIVIGGLTRRAAPGGFLDQLYDNGAWLFFDTVAVHPYGPSVADVIGNVRAVRAVMARRGDNKPLRITEYGWATGGNRSNLTVEPACQAALMHAATRRLTELRDELGIRSIVEFMWNDQPPLRDIWPYYAGLVAIDGVPKPALGAFGQAVAALPPPHGLTLAEACPADRRELG